MGRPLGGKNNIRTPEEKEAIVLEWLNGKAGYRVVAEEQGVKGSVLKQWKKKYLENGIEGLKSGTGKHSNPYRKVQSLSIRSRET